MHIVPGSVKQLSADNIGRSYISVKWTNPKGARHFIGVTYGKAQSVATVKVATGAHTQIGGLEPGTEYNVNVYSKSGARNSITSHIAITTSELIYV